MSNDFHIHITDIKRSTKIPFFEDAENLISKEHLQEEMNRYSINESYHYLSHTFIISNNLTAQEALNAALDILDTDHVDSLFLAAPSEAMPVIGNDKLTWKIIS